MSHAPAECEHIRQAIEAAEVDQPLTASEILDLLEEQDAEFESAHEVATVLGRLAESGVVEVETGRPYRYRFEKASS
jgi:predicted transcriptional regulator